MRGLRASRLSTVAEKLCRPASYSGSVDGLLTRAVARHGNQRDERAAFECAPKIQPPAGIRGRPPIGRPATVPGARPFSTGDAAAQHPRHARSAVSMDTLGAGTWPSAARGLPSVIFRLGRGTPAVCANRHSGAWSLGGGGGGETVGGGCHADASKLRQRGPARRRRRGARVGGRPKDMAHWIGRRRRRRRQWIGRIWVSLPPHCRRRRTHPPRRRTKRSCADRWRAPVTA